MTALTGNLLLQYQTQIFELQLLGQIILGGAAIIVTYVIFRRQLLISNKQNQLSEEQLHLSRWQFEVDYIRYKLDVANNKSLDLTNKSIYIDTKLSTHDLTDAEIVGLASEFEKNKIAYDSNQQLIQDLITEYNLSLSKNPDHFTAN